jgi:hypothetical protein
MDTPVSWPTPTAMCASLLSYWEWTELEIPAKTTELQCLLIKHVFWLTVGV